MITSCFSLFLLLGRQHFFSCHFKCAFQVIFRSIFGTIWDQFWPHICTLYSFTILFSFQFHFECILGHFNSFFFCSFYKALYITMIWVWSYGKIEGLAILGITSKWNLRSSEICWKSSGNWIDFLHRLLVDFWLPFQQLWR